MDVTNDDEQERRNRRRSHAADLLSAPSDAAAGEATEAAAAAPGPLHRMTAKELTEHYEDCIKLSAEGKISAKNAFALHLIDYLEGLVKRDKIDSFQVASSSLDAGAKIYAGRVDAVHQEAYKVLGGLGRSSAVDKKANGDDEDEDNSDGGHGGAADEDEEGRPGKGREKKRRAAAAKKAVLAANLARIRLKPASMRFDVDPLFQQQAAAYDDGGTGELRLNNVRVLDNRCEILLDSDAPVCIGATDVETDGENAASEPVVSLGPARAALATVSRDTERDEMMDDDAVATKPASLFLAFAGFSFLRRAVGADGGDGVGDVTRADQSALLADFVARLPPPLQQPQQLEASDDGYHHGMDGMEDDDDHHVGGFDGSGGGGGATAIEVNIGSNREPVVVQAATDGDETGFHPNASRNFVEALRDMLSDRGLSGGGGLGGSSGGFGGVDLFRLGMWAGPANWKRKCKLTAVGASCAGSGAAPFSACSAAAAAASAAMPPPVGAASRREAAASKTSAAAAQLLADKMQDWRRMLAQVRSGHKLTDAVIYRNMLRKLELPELTLSSVAATGGRPNLLLLTADSRQTLYLSGAPGNQLAGDAAMLATPGDAANDSAAGANSAAEVADDLMADDDADLSTYHAAEAGDLEGQTALDQPFADAFFSQAVGGTQQQQQGVSGSQQPLQTLQQPYKVNQLDIAYAKTAKRINISRLKQSMWQLLRTDGGDAAGLDISQDDASVAADVSQASQHQPVKVEFDGERSFVQLLQQLPPKVGANTAQDLSVSIVFSCLLYLANEKTLHLTAGADLADLTVAHGLPQHEITVASYYRMP